MPEKKNTYDGLGVEGIVAKRNYAPYIVLFKEDKQIAQLTMADARNFAHNILTMCARSEADAMIFKFFDREEFPAGAGADLMLQFRLFRFELDSEPVEKTQSVPHSDQFDFTKKKPQ